MLKLLLPTGRLAARIHSAVNGLFSGFANYKMGKSVWDNSLDLGYGLIKQGKDEAFRKTDDKIDFLSKYGQEAFKNFYYSALMNFKTQMTSGYNYPDDTRKISGSFFTCIPDLLALGLDYKPNAYFSAFIAPVTEKFTIVTDKQLSDQGAFGVSPGKTSRSEFGGYLRAIYSKNDFKSRISEKCLIHNKNRPLSQTMLDNPQNIDVSWESLIAMKVNKYISVNFNTHLIYDDNIAVPFDKNDNGTIETGEASRSKLQFKEIFGVGLSYKF